MASMAGVVAGGVVAAMASPASYHLTATEALFVDLVHYLDHPAGDKLSRRIFIPLGIGATGADVAIAAAHVQSGRKEAHGPHELVDGKTFQNLNVLEDVVGHLRLGLRKGRACEGQRGAQQCHRTAIHQCSFRWKLHRYLSLLFPAYRSGTFLHATV